MTTDTPEVTSLDPLEIIDTRVEDGIQQRPSGDYFTDVEPDYSLDMQEVPLYYHHTVTILRGLYRHDEVQTKVTTDIITSLSTSLETPFLPGGDVEYLSASSRAIAHDLRSSPVMTIKKTGDDLLRACSFHQAFDTKMLFIKTPHIFNKLLGMPGLRQVAQQSYLSYQNLIIIRFWEPGLADGEPCVFPLCRHHRTAHAEHFIIGRPLDYTLDKCTGEDYTVAITTVVNFIKYLAITAGMERSTMVPRENHWDLLHLPSLFSPLGHKGLHTRFLQ